MAYTVCQPLDHFRRPSETRSKASYSARWPKVVADLEREADYLGAEEVVILLDVRRNQLRIDGWPKAVADVPPPVAVAFTSGDLGALRFECDRWNSWRDNVRAIGLTLERLRLVDAGGVARSGEQYRGWQAIGPGAPTSLGAAMTLDEAARLLEQHSVESPLSGRPVATARDILADPRSREMAYRVGAKKLHPDAGGDRATFERLTAARDLLKASQ